MGPWYWAGVRPGRNRRVQEGASVFYLTGDIRKGSGYSTLSATIPLRARAAPAHQERGRGAENASTEDTERTSRKSQE